MDKRQKINDKNWHSYIFFLLLAVVYVCLFSYSTSVLFPYYYGGDSAQFQTIGREWALGKVPYRDLFDHKGPYIFLINMVGYRLTGDSKGVMFLQIINLFAFLVGTYKLSSLVKSKASWYRPLAVISTLIVLTVSYSHGNLTAEYCLPFIVFSIFLQAKYLFKVSEDKNAIKHKAVYGFFYGVAFSICVLTRITNGVTICAGVLVISLILLKNREYRNLINNGISLCTGVLVPIIPFALYFWQKGAFADFIYGMLGYNFEYQRGMESWLLQADLSAWIYFVTGYISYFMIFPVIVLLLCRRQFIVAFYCMLCAVLESYLFFSGAKVWQYAIIAIPQFTLLLNEIHELRKQEGSPADILSLMACVNGNQNLISEETLPVHANHCAVTKKTVWNVRMKNKMYLFLTSVMVLGIMLISGTSVYRIIDMHNRYSIKNEPVYQKLIDHIPDEDRGSFMAYGDGAGFKQIYLLNDITVCGKYFVIQEWHAGFSEKTRQDIHTEFEIHKAEWILTDDITETIQDILDRDYELIDRVDKYSLYHLREL